jgi:hypothetical protein
MGHLFASDGPERLPEIIVFAAQQPIVYFMNPRQAFCNRVTNCLLGLWRHGARYATSWIQKRGCHEHNSKVVNFSWILPRPPGDFASVFASCFARRAQPPPPWLAQAS